MKSPCIVAGSVHAQTQLWRKTSGPNLCRTVGQAVQQGGLPALGVFFSVKRQQAHQLIDLCFVHGCHPPGIKPRGGHQLKQLSAVNGLRRSG